MKKINKKIGNLTVHVVDDHQPTLDLALHALVSGGVQKILGFTDGQALLSHLDAGGPHPDIVFTDLMMPKVDGIQLIRELKSRRYGGGLVVMTGVDEGVNQAALRLARLHGFGMSHVIVKPIRRGALFEAISQLQPALSRASANNASMVEVDAFDTFNADSYFNCYQLKMESVSGRIKGAEALLRRHSKNTMHGSPGYFIPLLEERGLILAATQDVLEKAAHDLKAFKSYVPDFKMAVNVSVDCLSDIHLPEKFASILTREGLSPVDFILEITESKIMNQALESIEVLGRLRMMGWGLSIDDFGTGYSSLGQLLNLPFGELKIDSSFVTGAYDDRRKAAVLTASVDMAKKMGLNTVAEGIESSADMQFAIQSGVDVMQGYFFGRPVPADDFLQHLASWEVDRQILWDHLKMGSRTGV